MKVRATVCFLAFLLPLMPVASNTYQPHEAVPLASVRTTTASGLESSATLYYDPDFKTYKVTYLLEPDQAALYHDRGVPRGVYYLFQSILRDDGGLYACYTNMDGTQRPPETPIGVRNAQVDPAPMGACKTRECHMDGDEQVCEPPVVHHRVGNPIGSLRWEIYAGIVGVSHEEAPDPSILGSFFNSLIDGTIVAAFCGPGALACKKVGEFVVGVVIGAVTDYDKARIESEADDIFLHQQTMLSTSLTMSGIPTVQASLAPITDGADTFDLVEFLFYHPHSPVPFAKDDPYGGGFSTGAGANVADSFGASGTISDMNARVWDAKPGTEPRFDGGTDSSGETGQAANHAIPYVGRLLAGSGGGAEWDYEIYSFWDYEFPNESTLDDFIDFGQTALGPVGNVFDWQVDYAGPKVTFAPAPNLAFAQGPVETAPGFPGLTSQMMHNVTAKGVVGSASHGYRQVYLIDFHPFPMDLVCLSICTATEPVIYTVASPLERDALIAAIDAYRASESLPAAYYMTMGVNHGDANPFLQNLDFYGYSLAPWSSGGSLLSPLLQETTDDQEAFPDYDVPLYFIVYRL